MLLDDALVSHSGRDYHIIINIRYARLNANAADGHRYFNTIIRQGLFFHSKITIYLTKSHYCYIYKRLSLL